MKMRPTEREVGISCDAVLWYVTLHCIVDTETRLLVVKVIQLIGRLLKSKIRFRVV